MHGGRHTQQEEELLVAHEAPQDVHSWLYTAASFCGQLCDCNKATRVISTVPSTVLR